jgi:hypothetical protein
MQNHNFTYCFVLVGKLVSHIKGRAFIDSVQEQDAEENVCT